MTRRSAGSPRGGPRPEWQGRLAAQRWEEDRRARDRQRRAREQEQARQQEHLQSRQQEAAERTAGAAQRMAVLGEVLTSALARPPVTFAQLMIRPEEPPFDPGSLDVPLPAPDWHDFAPPRPRGLSRFLGGGARHRRRLAMARELYAAAQSEHRSKEAGRQQALAAARARYHQELTEERARAAAHNAAVARREAEFAAGEAGAVEWFAGQVLAASRYPDGFPRQYRVAYRQAAREVVMEAELPGRDVVPAASAYRYVAERDAIEPVPRPGEEIQQCRQRIVCAVALRVLHEIFSATPPDVVRAAEFRGYLSAVDPATGRPARPGVLRVPAQRAVFEDLVLDAVDPAACVAYLNGEAQPGEAQPRESQPRESQPRESQPGGTDAVAGPGPAGARQTPGAGGSRGQSPEVSRSASSSTSSSLPSASR